METIPNFAMLPVTTMISMTKPMTHSKAVTMMKTVPLMKGKGGGVGGYEEDDSLQLYDIHNEHENMTIMKTMMVTIMNTR